MTRDDATPAGADVTHGDASGPLVGLRLIELGTLCSLGLLRKVGQKYRLVK